MRCIGTVVRCSPPTSKDDKFGYKKGRVSIDCPTFHRSRALPLVTVTDYHPLPGFFPPERWASTIRIGKTQ